MRSLRWGRPAPRRRIARPGTSRRARRRPGVPRRHRRHRHRQHDGGPARRHRDGDQRRHQRLRRGGDRRQGPLPGPVPEPRHLHRHRRASTGSRPRSRASRSASARRPRADIALEVGGVNERVEVVAEAPMLNTTTAISGTTIDEQADRGAAARRRHRLHADAARAGHHGLLGPALRAAGRQRQPRRHRRQRRAGRQRVHASTARRTCRTRAASASRRRRTRSRSSRSRPTPSTRRPATPPAPSSTSRSRAAPTRCTVAGGYFNRDASRTATPLLTERAGGTKPTRTYNRYTGTRERPDRQEQDVLHGLVRAPARRAARAGDLHGADREDAQRRLQRVHDARSTIRSTATVGRRRARRSPAT